MRLGKHQKRAIAFLKANEGSVIYRDQIGFREDAWFVLKGGCSKLHRSLGKVLLSLIRRGIVESVDGSNFFTLPAEGKAKEDKSEYSRCRKNTGSKKGSLSIKMVPDS